jgi:transcriptional regulator with XRE-family HTH domain
MSSEPASATRKRVGANVREYRVNAGMSISEVSERMGVSQHDLEMIESGQAGLWDVHAIDRLAECCNLSLVQKKRLHDLAGLDKNTSLAASARIFISYRRDDQAALAGRLYDKLAARFGDAQVFVDVCSIETGVDYYDVLEQALSQCQVLLAIIGKDWITATGRDGKRRLDDPDDLVRVEIETALKRNIRVIPILVEGTQMPRADDLPKSLKLLARRNGQSIVHERFATDVSALIATLEPILGNQSP